MVNKKNKQKKRLLSRTTFPFEADGIYFLKLVFVVLLSTLWVKLATPFVMFSMPIMGIPVGFFAVIVLIRIFENNPIDRKIWFAVSMIITILSYFVPAGVVI